MSEQVQHPPTLREREPALVIGVQWSMAIAAVGAVLQAFGVVNMEQASAVEALLYALAALAPTLVASRIRRDVMPVATVKRAGLDPQEVIAAADPNDPTPKYDSEAP